MWLCADLKMLRGKNLKIEKQEGGYRTLDSGYRALRD
jgi:hypothetical protein